MGVTYDQGCQIGGFFAYSRPSAVAGWLGGGKRVARLISAVSASWDESDVLSSCGDDGSSCGGLPAGDEGGATAACVHAAARPLPPRQLSLTGAAPTAQYIFPSCGLTVKQGSTPEARGACHAALSVHSDNGLVAAFVGRLTNLRELTLRYGPVASARGPAGAASSAPPSTLLALGGGACRLPSAGAVGAGCGERALAAAVVLAMYQQDESEELLLSELQGQYAFVVLDASRRAAFAARDPQGSQALFYRIGDDGSVSFASSRAAMPAGAAAGAGACGEWLEVPPGHFISGRPARLRQFALTPEQLQVRDLWEESLGLGDFECDSRRSSSDDGGVSRLGSGGSLWRPFEGALDRLLSFRQEPCGPTWA